MTTEVLRSYRHLLRATRQWRGIIGPTIRQAYEIRRFETNPEIISRCLSDVGEALANMRNLPTFPSFLAGKFL